MIAEPAKWVTDFKDAGCDLYCFHYEAAVKPCVIAKVGEKAEGEKARTIHGVAELVRYVHEQGMLAGVAVKPATSVDVLWEILENPRKEEVPDVSSVL